MAQAPLPWLTERAAPDREGLRVDEEAGVIYGVRICGRFSPNNHGLPGVTEGTEYAKPWHEAKPYEGQTIYCDHVLPAKGSTPSRPVRDTFGILRNTGPVQESEGTVSRGELHYLKNHPMASAVVESVRRGLGLFGLSHHAKPAKASVVKGRYVVEAAERVESVDLVNRPATNKNLQESQAVATKKLREVLEECLPKSKRIKDGLEALKVVLEMDDAPAVMDAPVDAPSDDTTDPDQATDDAFKQAASAQIEAYFSGTLSAAEMFSKLKALFKAHGKLNGGGDGGDDSDSDSDGAPKTESVELRTLRAENACLKAGVKPAAVVLEALSHLDTDEKRTAFLAELKPAEKAADSAPANGRPRSGAPMPKPKTPSTTEAEAPKTVEEFRAYIRG